MRENPLDVVRLMLTGQPLRASQKPSEAPSAMSALLERLNGKKASVASSECSVCGSSNTKKVEIPRHSKEPIARCPGCGLNYGPGKNTVRGSTNYTGSPGSFYDE